jgi:hypothetical protein
VKHFCLSLRKFGRDRGKLECWELRAVNVYGGHIHTLTYVTHQSYETDWESYTDMLATKQ